MRAPFGDVVTIWSTAIVLVPMVECAIAPYAREGRRAKRCSTQLGLQLLFALMAGAGVVVVSKPSFLFSRDDDDSAASSAASSGKELVGYLCAVGNAFAATSSYVIVGQLDHVRWAVVDFYFVPAAIMVKPIINIGNYSSRNKH